MVLHFRQKHNELFMSNRQELDKFYESAPDDEFGDPEGEVYQTQTPEQPLPKPNKIPDYSFEAPPDSPER